jgi:TetR/AcrR family transcriptional regulator, transcriptional repressor for nem operon
MTMWSGFYDRRVSYAGGVSTPVTPKGRRARDALLKAGVAVADKAGLAGLTVAAVSEEAGLAKGTFYLYFPDRDAFIDALHQRFYERVNEAVLGEAAHLPDGLEKQLTAIDAYLDVCLENKGVKALVLETRSRPGLTTYMEEREELFARLSEPNFKAMGASNPRVAARLAVAMTSETALIELDAGRRVPAARTTLRQLVTGIQAT